MTRQIKIARDGQELGAWPFDVVFALIRCGSLVPTDIFSIDSMDEWKPLSEVIPPSPSHTKPATFLGRPDEDCTWMFYCQNGSVVVGPHPNIEVVALMMVGVLNDDDLVFTVGGDRWMSVADYMRMIEKDSPGTIDQRRRIQAVLAESASTPVSTAPLQEEESNNPDWLQTGLNLSAVSPHIGGLYLGIRAVKQFTKWLDDTKSQNNSMDPKTVRFNRDGKDMGEYTFKVACEMVQSGEVKMTDYYRSEGMGEWRLLSDDFDH